MSHPFTRIVFRVGDDDAKKLAEGFSYFEAKDLRNLEAGQAIARVERSDYDFNLSIPLPVELEGDATALRREEVISASRKKYGTSREDVEAMLAKSRASVPQDTPSASPPPKPSTSIPKAPPAGAGEVPPPSPPAVIPQPSEPPKPAEVPKETGLETKSPAVFPSSAPPTVVNPPVDDAVIKPQERREPAPPRDLGRGGAQHQAIQQRIKRAAEALGFHGVIEQQILDGLGSVDLLLERGDTVIACEISVTTTIDHEVGNVAKCLKAGIQNVAVITLDEERLRKIETAVSGGLGSDAAARVLYSQPEQFIKQLQAAPRPADAPATRHGYKIKRSLPTLTTAEQKQKEDAAIRMIAETMRH
jgi:hypothetical protein